MQVFQFHSLTLLLPDPPISGTQTGARTAARHRSATAHSPLNYGAVVGKCGAAVGKCGAAVGKCGAAVGKCGAAVGKCGAVVGKYGAVVGKCGAAVCICLMLVPRKLPLSICMVVSKHENDRYCT